MKYFERACDWRSKKRDMVIITRKCQELADNMNMDVFECEDQMQKWLSDELAKKEGLSELIDGADILDVFVPTNQGEARVCASFRACMKSLHVTRTLFENENISLGSPDVLKPDFLLYALETESIVILELKNSASPSRQAGTELGAYTAEVRTCVPFLADGDVVHVLIAQEWPVLLKHYVRHEIFWQGRKLLCLRPLRKNDGGLCLEILPVSEIAEDYTSFQIGTGHLGGYNIALYDDQLYGQNADQNRLSTAMGVFKVGIQAMAVSGNRNNSHGFAFLWKDTWLESLAPYSVVVANFAPFRSLERFVKNSDIPPVIDRFIRVVADICPEGHGSTLSEVTDTFKTCVKHLCSPQEENFATWDVLSESLAGRMELVAYAGWGLFGDAAVEEVIARHKKGDLACSLEDPSVGMAVLENLIDDQYHVMDLSYYGYDPDDDA